MTARVRVPASSSNLGSGFDCIGVAIDRWLVASVTLAGETGTTVRRRGRLTAVSVPADQDLLVRGFFAACAAARVAAPGAAIDATSDIPVGCGLGSSAAAIVAGVSLADAALELHLTRQQIVDIATAIEGHPDNVAPAVYGGAVLTVRGAGTAGGLVSTSLQVATSLELLIAVPPFPSDTKAARALLPKTLPHADAVLAASRAAALVQGLATGDGALLGAALDDVLHVPFRRGRIPGYDAVVAAAQKAGAFGATLSGAGSAILAIAPRERSAAVGAAMLAAWRDDGIEAELIKCTSDVAGASVIAVPRTPHHAPLTTHQ
ncbi:MAG TPA: homoserine kinase [Gemmatimonadales bacterium]|jgi:homoserine kinase